MDNSNLTFNETLSVEDFMSKTGAKSLDLANNPETGKDFFLTNIRRISGKVSKKLDVNKDVVISDVTDEDTAETFYLMHNRGVGNLEIKKSWSV